MIVTKKSFLILLKLLLRILTRGPKNIRLMNDEQTLENLIQAKKGIVRYGNSELSYIAGLDIKTQRQNNELRRKLIEILEGYCRDDSYIIGFPIDMVWSAHSSGRIDVNKVWGLRTRIVAKAYVKNDALYGSPFIFRLKDVQCRDKIEYSKKIYKLLSKKDLIYIGPCEGKNSKPPSGLRYRSTINIPEANAYDVYTQVFEKAITVAKSYERPLVLIVGGVMATALSAELNAVGIRAFDLGQMGRHLRESDLS